MLHTRIRTRIISTLLSAAMCLSMFPAQAFAATVEAKLQVEAETQSPIAVLGGDAETVEDASEAAEQDVYKRQREQTRFFVKLYLSGDDSTLKIT